MSGRCRINYINLFLESVAMAVSNNEDFPESLYSTYKPLLFSLAYRMLGSVMDAEDIVHESFLALRKTGWEHVCNIRAYLCKIVTNRCLDHLRSSANKRELYPGPWLPEPLVGEAGSVGEENDPLQSYVHKESLATAYMLLLQQLSYVERAVFLLREALQYDYDEIADIVGKSSVNCRQIYHRAKRSLGRPGPAGRAVCARVGQRRCRPADEYADGGRDAHDGQRRQSARTSERGGRKPAHRHVSRVAACQISAFGLPPDRSQRPARYRRADAGANDRRHFLSHGERPHRGRLRRRQSG